MQTAFKSLDLAQNRIERMLERAVELVPLRGAQLVEIGVYLFARVLEDLLAREDGLRDVVQHESRPGL